MRRPKKDIQLTSYDELLGLEETPEKSMNQVVEIDLAKLYAWAFILCWLQTYRYPTMCIRHCSV